MARKYLLGPVDVTYAHDDFSAWRSSGQCKVFASTGHPDVLVGREDRWEDVVDGLAPDWRADFVVVLLAYSDIPRCVWESPLPLVGLAADWHVLWHRYRFLVPRCDLVLTDRPGVRAFREAGMAGVGEANLYGCAPEFLVDQPAGPRDIDVLYVGSLHPAQKGDRLAQLGRIATSLGGRWNVVIRKNVDRTEYVRLLRRARVVFNRSVRGECNLRAFEAAATGALLFQEAENEEVAGYLRPNQECVFYTPDTLLPLLEHYLGNEAERARVARAAQERSRSLSFRALWPDVLARVELGWPEVVRRSAQRCLAQQESGDHLDARFWESFTASTRADRGADAEPALIRDLAARAGRPDGGRPDAALHNMLGLAVARRGQRENACDEDCTTVVASHFRRAVALAPGRPLFRLNLCEALWRLGRPDEAAEHARQALADLDQEGGLAAEELNAGHFPPTFDTFRVEWERAAWTYAGSPEGEAVAKATLVRWRLHSLLASAADDIAHYRIACELRGELWTSHAALGRALVRAGRAEEGVHHLRRAADLNPFDETLLPDLISALRACRDVAGERRAIEQVQLLRRAAPTTSCDDIRGAQEVVA